MWTRGTKREMSSLQCNRTSTSDTTLCVQAASAGVGLSRLCGLMDTSMRIARERRANQLRADYLSEIHPLLWRLETFGL